MPEEMAEERMVQPARKGQVAGIHQVPRAEGCRRVRPKMVRSSRSGRSRHRGTEETTEDEEVGAEDEEDTEGSRTGADTSVAVRDEEVSEASLTRGILRFRAR